jgi:hypothetical protein
MSTDLKIKIARDLRSILELCESLGDEAIEHPNDREMPGGEALNLVGPAANLSEWEQKYEDAEARAIADKQAMPKYANDQESELHPRLLLGWWSEIVRAERGQRTTCATRSRGWPTLTATAGPTSCRSTYSPPTWPSVGRCSRTC